MKEDLVAQAEALSTSTDWSATAVTYHGLRVVDRGVEYRTRSRYGCKGAAVDLLNGEAGYIDRLHAVGSQHPPRKHSQPCDRSRGSRRAAYARPQRPGRPPRVATRRSRLS